MMRCSRSLEQRQENRSSFRQIMEKSSLMVIHDDYVRQIETTDAYRVKKPFLALGMTTKIFCYSMPKVLHQEARPEGESDQISI